MKKNIMRTLCIAVCLFVIFASGCKSRNDKSKDGTEHDNCYNKVYFYIIDYENWEITEDFTVEDENQFRETMSRIRANEYATSSNRDISCLISIIHKDELSSDAREILYANPSKKAEDGNLFETQSFLIYSQIKDKTVDTLVKLIEDPNVEKITFSVS